MAFISPGSGSPAMPKRLNIRSFPPGDFFLKMVPVKSDFTISLKALSPSIKALSAAEKPVRTEIIIKIITEFNIESILLK